MTLSTSSSRAVSIRTGAFVPAARSRRRTSKPSMPGRRTSSRTRSGASFVANSRPSSPRAGERRPRSPPAGGRTGFRGRRRTRPRRSGSWRPSGAHGIRVTAPDRRSLRIHARRDRFAVPALRRTVGVRARPAPHRTARGPAPCPPPRQPSDLAAEPARSPARRSPTCAATAACRPSSSATASSRDSVSLDTHEFELLRRQVGPEHADRPVGRRREGRAGARPRGPGPSGHPQAAPRRPVRRADDRGADGRRGARLRGRVRGGRERSAARCSTSSSTSASGPCPDHLPRRSTTPSSRSPRSTTRSTSATWRSRPTRRCSPTRRGRGQGAAAARRGGAGRRPRPPRARRVPRARAPRASPRRLPARAERERGIAAARSPGSAGTRPIDVQDRQPQRHLLAAREPPARPRSLSVDLLALVRLQIGEQACLVELGVEVHVALRRPTRGRSSLRRTYDVARSPASRISAPAASA